jgi:hypothetical protein
MMQASRITFILDRNEDGSEDSIGATSLVADSIERACNELDGRLSPAYSVPFAAITDTTPTPGVVSDLADWLAGALIIEGEDPTSATAALWRSRVEARIKAIIKGDEDIPGLTRKTDGGDSVHFAWTGTYPTFAGFDDDDERMRGL